MKTRALNIELQPHHTTLPHPVILLPLCWDYKGPLYGTLKGKGTGREYIAPGSHSRTELDPCAGC